MCKAQNWFDFMVKYFRNAKINGLYFFKIHFRTFYLRIVLASQNIEAGQMIFSEYSIVNYPQWKTSPLCLGCYTSIDLDQCTQCTICNWPMCSEKCSQTEDHLLECGIFQKSGIKIDINEFKTNQKIQSVVPLYDMIIPLRMLALRSQRNQESWEKLTSLMSHSEEWAKNSTWKQKHKHAIGLFLSVQKEISFNA